MTNGEYLRLCQQHGVAPIYLDERPKQEKRKQPKLELVKTFGDGFALVTPTELPKQKAKKPLELAERPVAEGGRKKAKTTGYQKAIARTFAKASKTHPGRVIRAQAP
jgi:hypothetical protein